MYQKQTLLQLLCLFLLCGFLLLNTTSQTGFWTSNPQTVEEDVLEVRQAEGKQERQEEKQGERRDNIDMNIEIMMDYERAQNDKQNKETHGTQNRTEGKTNSCTRMCMDRLMQNKKDEVSLCGEKGSSRGAGQRYIETRKLNRVAPLKTKYLQVNLTINFNIAKLQIKPK